MLFELFNIYDIFLAVNLCNVLFPQQPTCVACQLKMCFNTKLKQSSNMLLNNIMSAILHLALCHQQSCMFPLESSFSLWWLRTGRDLTKSMRGRDALRLKKRQPRPVYLTLIGPQRVLVSKLVTLRHPAVHSYYHCNILAVMSFLPVKSFFFFFVIRCKFI